MQYHPDRNGGSLESEERLKRINEAYQVLGDEEKRKYYDLQYQQPFRDNVFRGSAPYEKDIADDLITVFFRFFQGDFDKRRTGCCGGRGLGRRCGCGRWKRRNFI
jgi:molecular chaperone DnaJ